MFDLDSNEEEVYLADDDVFQVVSRADQVSTGCSGREREERHDVLCFIILKLDMQTILDPNLHLDRHIRIRRHPIAVYPDFTFLYDVAHPACDGYPEKVSDAVRGRDQWVEGG